MQFPSFRIYALVIFEPWFKQFTVSSIWEDIQTVHTLVLIAVFYMSSKFIRVWFNTVFKLLFENNLCPSKKIKYLTHSQNSLFVLFFYLVCITVPNHSPKMYKKAPLSNLLRKVFPFFRSDSTYCFPTLNFPGGNWNKNLCGGSEPFLTFIA